MLDNLNKYVALIPIVEFIATDIGEIVEDELVHVGDLNTLPMLGVRQVGENFAAEKLCFLDFVERLFAPKLLENLGD